MVSLISMKTTKLLFGLGLLSILLSGCTLPFIKKKKAALEVISTPKATVFLNGNHVGQTPFFDENLKPDEYTLKLVPETTETSLLTWQGIVKLNQGIMTVVNRNLAESEDKSSGYILTLESMAEKEKIKVSIISTPDSAVVTLDGEPKGFTPLVLEDVPEGERLLTISAPGFKEETIKAKTVKGYKLMVDIQLATEIEEETEEEEEEATESAKPSPKPSSDLELDEEATEGGTEMEKPYVKIKDTPTDWLNIRSEPSTAAKEETVLTKIYPGEVYKFIEANDTGWYKIEYEEGKQGWISGKYTTLYR